MRLFILSFVALVMAAPLAVQASGLSRDHQKLSNALQSRLFEIEKELNRIDEVEALPKINFGVPLFRAGMSHPNIPLLRAKLMAYDIEQSFDYDPHLYDPVLVDAVKAFQKQQGLRADGILGPDTLTLINRGLVDEKRQIEVNLQRLTSPEWFNRPPLRIEVDIARYVLTAYEGNEIAFEMPVVVGTKERQTNVFTTVMTGVRINPGWTLPPTIKSEDYIPKLRTDPQWVTDKGVMIYTSWDTDAVPVDPTAVDWDFLTDKEIKAMRFYKKAGNNNPLGRWRFLMNNQYDIYLHDTNQKYLFDRSARAKSSGCVRVYDPRKVAEFLLKDDLDWTAEKLDAVLDSGKTVDLGAKRSIPVYFDYKTAWIDSTGKLVLGRDIYGFDADSYRDMIKVQSKNQKQLDTL
jgi:murein L,D-transpeptidase YcbB/YkuD